MALTFHTYKLLEKFDDNIDGFGEVLSLGQINNLINKDDFNKLSVTEFKDQYSNKLLLKNFNIKSINSLDYSNFEGADIIHDLNLPIKDIAKQFDTIIDFGTSEHIFNIIQNFKNISSLCKTGGKILHCLPANNNCGHGFWQFSPELFFQLYQKSNGYSETEIYLLNLHDKKNFYKIKVQEKGTRLELNSKEPLYIFIKTKKIGDNKFDNINQSDYVDQWSTSLNKTQKPKNKLSKFNKKIKDGIKNILKNNFFLKDVYTNLENTKIHNKNNFKINKNLEKLEF
jgi:hypothetical protein